MREWNFYLSLNARAYQTDCRSLFSFSVQRTTSALVLLCRRRLRSFVRSSGNDLFSWKAERVGRLINSCLHDHSWIFHNTPARTKLLDGARRVQRSGPSVIKNEQVGLLFFFSLSNFLWNIYGSSCEKRDGKVKRILCTNTVTWCVLRPWRRKRKKEREFERQICALLGQCVKRLCWSLDKKTSRCSVQ